MIFVVISACVWFGVGILVGRRRAQRAYQLELAKFEALPSAERDALMRALAVFLGWAAAGLVGAILWVLLWAFLIIGHAMAEDMSKSKKGRSSAGFWLLLGGLLLVNEESLRSIEENADDFVIMLAFILALMAVVIAVAVWG